MTPEEARLILQCRRPNGQDDALPVMQEAEALLAGHPDLLAGLAADRELDAILATSLRSVSPPAGLRENILAGARITPVLPWWKRRTAWLAAAAVLAIAGALATRPPSSGNPGEIVQNPPALESADISAFQSDTTAKVSGGGIHLAVTNPDVSRLQEWVASHSGLKHVPVPEGMAGLSTYGCEVFSWRGREVTLMCFDAGELGIVHLFTIDASTLPDGPDQPLFATSHDWQTMTWKSDGKILLLAGKATPEQLQKLVLRS